MVKEISQPKLATYENPPYFYCETPAAGVVFQAPVNGKTTPGSSYPRSELRQMINGGTDEAHWSNAKHTWTMRCALKFTHLPGGKPHVVGMQVHDGVDDVTVLRQEGSDLYITKGDDTHFHHVGSVPAGTMLNMQVTARKGGGFEWYRDGAHVVTVPGVKSGCYFKAGCYTQANTTNGTGYGEVTIYSLSIAKEA